MGVVTAALAGVLWMAPSVQQLVGSSAQVSIPPAEKVMGSRDIAVWSRDAGDSAVTGHLFRILPWNAVRSHGMPQAQVVVGGQSIGVRIRSNRVTVIGYEHRMTESPAEAAHIVPGDVIEKIGSHPVYTAGDVHRWVNASSSPLTLTIRRGRLRRMVTLRPLQAPDGTRRLGLYVRDSTSGIGTLTFYDPRTGRFGALGHVITDVDSGVPVEGIGSLYEAEVTATVRGLPGRPGEKRGHLNSGAGEIGKIVKNTEFGVFGTLSRPPSEGYEKTLMPVALPSQVHTGPAKLLTVLHGHRVQAYDVVIETVAKQESPAPKSLVIRVTDPRLLTEAGGIVQGMSGSPVIQDGRLAAAVTHVFVSDVTRGYGVYAAWMFQEARQSALPTSAGKLTAHEVPPRALQAPLARPFTARAPSAFAAWSRLVSAASAPVR
ncbi:MAG: SpoIVB peptidase [Alicyclobacillus sp.]|nr:SpoIVB peptidase [Alicyclobacillus sp.]